MERAAALWAKLPADTAAALLLSGDGEERLSTLAAQLLDHLGDPADPDLTAVFADMALTAWEIAPLSARAAGIVRQVHSQRPYLSEQAAAFCALAATLRPGKMEEAAELNKRIGSGDLEAAKDLTSRNAAAEPGNLFWLRFAAFLGLQLGELDWYEPWPGKYALPAAFAAAFRADCAFAREDWSKAAVLYATAYAQANLTEWLVREGECLRRQGRRGDAAERWQQALALRPWQINLRLRLTDLERGADIPGAPPAGRGEILLYSWNHGPDLDAALAALAASDLGSCGLTVLDNGSTDSTPDVIRAWQDRLGGRMRSVTLPVNVGAPAARNWLLALETSKTADWVVFLDDDALVPPDWLGLFGTALRLHPNAGIVGCRVVDMAAPMTVQSVDLHFEPQADPKTGERAIVSTHMTGPDFGQYSYLRPAVSVTGCCHLLTRKNIDEIGAFDLRFSPSQFDDFERDLRSCTKGHYPLYQGHLRVRHIKRSGVIAQTPPWQKANIDGNLVKLKAAYGGEVVKRITETNSEILGAYK